MQEKWLSCGLFGSLHRYWRSELSDDGKYAEQECDRCSSPTSVQDGEDQKGCNGCRNQSGRAQEDVLEIKWTASG